LGTGKFSGSRGAGINETKILMARAYDQSFQGSVHTVATRPIAIGSGSWGDPAIGASIMRHSHECEQYVLPRVVSTGSVTSAVAQPNFKVYQTAHFDDANSVNDAKDSIPGAK
jgi:hypothetical protein